MRKYNTSDRLKQLMKDRNLRQVDILNMVLPVCKKYGLKMNRSDISQYVSGTVLPNQRKLVAMAEALNVSETWLMGYGYDEYIDDEIIDSGMVIAEMLKDKRMVNTLYKLSKLQPSDKETVVNLIKILYEKGESE